MAKSEDLARIIEGCKDGDQSCFSRLIDVYSRQLYGYFYRLTGDRDISEDLLSELFVKLVEKIASFRGGSFQAWLFKIASNIFHDFLRQKQRQLNRLDSDTRELIMLRFYSEMSFKELSKMRGEPIGTTLSKVHRGLSKLRELME